MRTQMDAHNSCGRRIYLVREHTRKEEEEKREREKLEAEAAEEAQRMDEKNCSRTELGHGWNCICQEPTTAMIKASYSLFSRLDT
jgi:hypothetical protein